MPAVKSAESSIGTGARTTIKRTVQGTSTCAIGRRSVQKLEKERGRTVSLASRNHSQRTSLEFERLPSPQGTTSRSTRSHPSSEKVLNIEEIFFDAQAKISFSGAKTSKVEGNIDINRTIQVSALFLLDTVAGPDLISKSILLPFQQSHLLSKLPVFVNRAKKIISS